MLSRYLSEASGEHPAKTEKDEDGEDHGGTMKIDATCCSAEVRYPTDTNLLEDGNRLIDRLLDKICDKHHLHKPQTHRTESRQAFLAYTKKKKKSKSLVEKTKRIQLRCLQADIQVFREFLGKLSSRLLACFSRFDCRCLKAACKMYEQQKQMFEEGVRTCADRIIGIYQPHLRPIVRGKAKAKTEFGAKIGASIVGGYTYVDHLSWDAYNESSDLSLQTELYKQRFGMLPQEIQADKLYLSAESRKYIRKNHIDCFNRPLGRPPKEENDQHLEDKKRAIGERNEIEATFGTARRVYGADNIRAKLDTTADAWIGACFFAKNVMKFLRGLLRLFVEILGFRSFFIWFFANRNNNAPVPAYQPVFVKTIL